MMGEAGEEVGTEVEGEGKLSQRPLGTQCNWPIGKEGRSERGEEVGNRSVPMTRMNIYNIFYFYIYSEYVSMNPT